MKKIFKSVALMLALTLIIGLFPMNTQAATPKLNVTKKTMYKGDYLKLKVKNTKKTVTWSTSNKNVASVSWYGDVWANGEGTATITAKVGGKKYKCKITVKLTEEDTLRSINGFIIGSLWNDGFCDLSHYLYDKTSSVGGAMNIDYTLKKLDKSFEKLGEYDKYIQSLKGHEDLKEVWNLMVLESADLYIKIHNVDWNTFECEKDFNERTNYEEDYVYPFDVSMFRTYMYDFDELVP